MLQREMNRLIVEALEIAINSYEYEMNTVKVNKLKSIIEELENK